MRSSCFVWFLGCGSGVSVVEPPADTECAQELSWEHVGQAFMLNYCTGCHSSHLSGSARHGATSGVDLDSLDGVRAHLDRIESRVVHSGDMPPGGGPSALETSQLAAWLECGAPGEEAVLPDTEEFPSGLAGYGLVARVTEDSPGMFTVMRDLQDAGFGLPHGTYIVESYELSGDEAWFHGFWIYGSDDEVEYETWWEPPLHVQGEAVDIVQETIAVVTLDGVSETRDQVWSWSREEVTGGGLEQDPNPTELAMVESQGLLQVWHVSDDRGFTARQFSIEDGRYWDLLQQSSDVSLPSGLEFPVVQGANWIERLVLVEGGGG